MTFCKDKKGTALRMTSTLRVEEFNSQLGSQVLKKNSCSTQLNMKFFLLINVKMPTSVGISIFMSRKNNIISLSEPKKAGRIS